MHKLVFVILAALSTAALAAQKASVRGRTESMAASNSRYITKSDEAPFTINGMACALASREGKAGLPFWCMRSADIKKSGSLKELQRLVTRFPEAVSSLLGPNGHPDPFVQITFNSNLVAVVLEDRSILSAPELRLEKASFDPQRKNDYMLFLRIPYPPRLDELDQWAGTQGILWMDSVLKRRYLEPAKLDASIQQCGPQDPRVALYHQDQAIRIKAVQPNELAAYQKEAAEVRTLVQQGQTPSAEPQSMPSPPPPRTAQDPLPQSSPSGPPGPRTNVCANERAELAQIPKPWDLSPSDFSEQAEGSSEVLELQRQIEDTHERYKSFLTGPLGQKMREHLDRMDRLEEAIKPLRKSYTAGDVRELRRLENERIDLGKQLNNLVSENPAWSDTLLEKTRPIIQESDELRSKKRSAVSAKSEELLNAAKSERRRKVNEARQALIDCLRSQGADAESEQYEAVQASEEAALNQ